MNSDEYVNIKIPDYVILERDRETRMVKAQTYDDNFIKTETWQYPLPIDENIMIRYNET